MSIHPSINTAQQRLITDIEDAAHWRRHKAHEHPDDVRNQRSADALALLALHVASLDPTDPRLATVVHASKGWADDAGFLTDAVSRVGFGRESVDLDAALTFLVDDAICTLMRDGIEVDNHEARDWLAEMIHEALDEAKVERSFTDEDERPAQDRRISALSNLLTIVRNYQSTAPVIDKARALCVADRARGLHPNTFAPLNGLSLHTPQDDLDWWLKGWIGWAISVEGLEVVQ